MTDVFTSFRKYCEKNLVVRKMVEPILSFTKDNLINEEHEFREKNNTHKREYFRSKKT